MSLHIAPEEDGTTHPGTVRDCPHCNPEQPEQIRARLVHILAEHDAYLLAAGNENRNWKERLADVLLNHFDIRAKDVSADIDLPSFRT